ncbi:Hint domain-containing protein [Roseobacter sp. YSTF-M11]|uniref:Hint domain-containing protein n=1 Tax=Roseobacter insulae TaxID=2859783 RepID=A0A9X1FSX8_9RHOB|nr:Hint domain-containing protein [Roseobacter insulae]MBW4707120.1 Hint domain-containing protein [Roseobacter insulae]
MAIYDIYVLGESALTISGGEQLDGVSQGDGSHLDGLTITLNSGAWQPVSIEDDDLDFRDNDGSQRLNGAQTIDGTPFADNAAVEAEYGLVLTDGVNSWTVVGFNVNNSSPAYATVEGLAFIGGPGGFPPVGVPLTVTSAFEGPTFQQTEYATPVCFATGTVIDTCDGPMPVERVIPGMAVVTRDHGAQRVLWAGRRAVQGQASFAPVHIAAGTMGNTADVLVSQQHKLLVTGWQAEMLFGQDEVLVPAGHLVGLTGVTRVTRGPIGYHHLLLEDHAVLRSAGMWSESFSLGAMALDALLPMARAQVTRDFPELIGRPPAYATLRKHEARLLIATAA